MASVTPLSNRVMPAEPHMLENAGEVSRAYEVTFDSGPDALPVNRMYYHAKKESCAHVIDANGSPRNLVPVPSSDPFNFREAESISPQARNRNDDPIFSKTRARESPIKFGSSARAPKAPLKVRFLLP